MPSTYSPFRDPRRRRIIRQSGALSTGAVAGLPIVLTVGVNSLTTTSGNIVGSVNPNGLATSWWIVYGTALPFGAGSTTIASTALGNGATPITVTYSLINLQPGTTYYAAVVGQSAAGTVYGQSVSFLTAVPPVIASQPIVPFGQPPVTIPHFSFPFTLVGATTNTPVGIAVTEQDTVEEVVSNVGVIMSCPVGACTQLPTFGRTEVLFAQEPIDTTGLETSIQQWEPRATEDIISQLALDGQSWELVLQTSTSTVSSQNA